MTNWLPESGSLKRPAYISLADHVAAAIERGALAPGERLPTHRELAERLNLSVQTVSRAYDDLIRRNLIDGQVGRGTYVRDDLRIPDMPFLPERRDGELIDLSMLKPIYYPVHAERFSEALRTIARQVDQRILTSFRPNTVFRRHREIALDWLRLCGLETNADNVQITNGVTPSMTIALMSVARPGSLVATEAIGHHTILPLTTYLGIGLRGVAIDEQGMIPEALDEMCAQTPISILYIVPTVANPTTTMMGEERRRRIVDIARKYNLTIIENDAFGPLVERTAPPIAALAPERTFYLTSFTKCVLPGLRSGYMVVPDDLIPSVANRQLVSLWMATPLIAEIAARWVQDGTALELAILQRHGLNQRNQLAGKYLTGMGARIHPSAMHVWLPLPAAWREESFVSQARLRGVAVAPSQSFVTENGVVSSAVRISVGSSSEDELRTGLRVLERLARGVPEPALLTI